MTCKIGFIGTGIMGGHMARNLAQAGLHVTAWNRSRAKAAALETHGVTVAENPVDAVAACDVAICMLSDGPTCDNVLFEQGVVPAMPSDGLLINMASIPVATAQAQAQLCAEHTVRFIDAPVSGGEKGAADGALVIMAGGEAADIEDAKSIFEILGRVTHVGPVGSGCLAKLCNQMIVANTIATVAEAMLLAKAGGADPAAVREALLGGFADSTILKVHAKRMNDKDFVPGGPAKYQVKDQDAALALAATCGLTLPMSTLARDLFSDFVESGGGDMDHSALYAHLHAINDREL